MAPAKNPLQNNIDKWLSCDMVRTHVSLHMMFFEEKTIWLSIVYRCIWKCRKSSLQLVRECPVKVCPSLVAAIFLWKSCFILLGDPLCVPTASPTCLFQSSISSWRTGRRRQTTAAGQFAARNPPHPDRRLSLPDNRTDHMTSFFHFEFLDKPEKYVITSH